MSFVYFQVDVHYLYQWIKGSSLLVNNIHTLYCTSLSNMCSIFDSYIDSSKQVFFNINSKSSLFSVW